MGETLRASNVDEAIECAWKFQKEGRFSWFRGQVKPWPPHSGSFRAGLRSKTEWTLGKTRAMNFVNWVFTTEGLEEIRNPDSAFAVAQHYGIPTDLIDFTTDPGVAGFFACDTSSPEIGTDSCIYCLDPEDLVNVWDTIREVRGKDQLPEIECLRLAVPNLWRLEAQKGVFLSCPINWEVFYPMAKIVFPNSGYPAYPTKQDIYPDRKSSLEILLDQYFMAETGMLNYANQVEFFKSLPIANKAWDIIPAIPERTHSEYFLPKSVPLLESWDKSRVKPWLDVNAEAFRDSHGPVVRLSISPEKPPMEFTKSISSGILRMIQNDPTIRRRNINWVLTAAPGSQYNAEQRLLDILHRVWDGMRSLPFSNFDLSEATANCILLYLHGLHLEADRGKAKAIAESAFGGEVMEVEFGAPDGSYSRGYVRKVDLESAIRADMLSLVKPESRERVAASIKFLLQIISSPPRMFEFDSLVNIFASQLIPSQALRRESNALLFSPARLDSLGEP